METARGDCFDAEANSAALQHRSSGEWIASIILRHSTLDGSHARSEWRAAPTSPCRPSAIAIRLGHFHLVDGGVFRAQSDSTN
jgi:hypothetical protein